MGAPTLKIPVAVDLAAFKQQMNQMSNGVGEAVKAAGQTFKRLNGDMLGIAEETAAGVALSWGRSAASFALKLSLAATAGVEGFKLLQASIEQAREDIADMIKIADQARNTAVTPEFYEKFIAESQKLQVSSDDLKTALDNAFQATKVELNEGWLQGDKTKTKVSDLAKTVNELGFELFTVSNQSAGVEIFKNAQTQEDRIRGVLTLMTELDRMGEQAVSLDLANKLFGATTADRIRQGRLSAEGLLQSVNQAAATSDNIFPSALVERAKDIDDQLKMANQRLSDDMKPSFEAIESTVLSIRSAWVGIVNLMAQAVELIGKMRPPSSQPGGGASATDLSALTGLQTRLRDTGLTPQQRDGLEEQLRALQAKITQDALKAGAFDLAPPGSPDVPSSVPLPQPRPANAPKPDTGGGSATADAFDRQTDSINRHIATLNADAAAVGKTAAEMEQMRAEAQLLQAIQRDDGEVTQDQIDKYTVLRASMSAQQALSAAGITLNQEHAETFANLSQRMGDAAARADEMKKSFQGINSAAVFGGNEIIGVMDSLGSKTLSAADAARQLGNDLIHALEQAAFLGQGPLANILGFSSRVSGGTGGLIGGLLKIFGFASGGYTGSGSPTSVAGVVHGGEYVFDANSTRRLGLPFLEDLRKGIRGYAAGGLVVAPGGESACELIGTSRKVLP